MKIFPHTPLHKFKKNTYIYIFGICCIPFPRDPPTPPCAFVFGVVQERSRQRNGRMHRVHPYPSPYPCCRPYPYPCCRPCPYPCSYPCPTPVPSPVAATVPTPVPTPIHKCTGWRGGGSAGMPWLGKCRKETDTEE
jgi:hypothetical protein